MSQMMKQRSVRLEHMGFHGIICSNIQAFIGEMEKAFKKTRDVFITPGNVYKNVEFHKD